MDEVRGFTRHRSTPVFAMITAQIAAMAHLRGATNSVPSTKIEGDWLVELPFNLTASPAHLPNGGTPDGVRPVSVGKATDGWALRGRVVSCCCVAAKGAVRVESAARHRTGPLLQGRLHARDDGKSGRGLAAGLAAQALGDRDDVLVGCCVELPPAGPGGGAAGGAAEDAQTLMAGLLPVRHRLWEGAAHHGLARRMGAWSGRAISFRP